MGQKLRKVGPGSHELLPTCPSVERVENALCAVFQCCGFYSPLSSGFEHEYKRTMLRSEQESSPAKSEAPVAELNRIKTSTRRNDLSFRRDALRKSSLSVAATQTRSLQQEKDTERTNSRKY